MKETNSSKVQALYPVMFTEYPDVVNTDQLCEMLGGVAIKSVYRLLREGKIKAFRIGKGYKIPKVSVIEYITALEKSAS